MTDAGISLPRLCRNAVEDATLEIESACANSAVLTVLARVDRLNVSAVSAGTPVVKVRDQAQDPAIEWNVTITVQ
jgi:hypothetical protein